MNSLVLPFVCTCIIIFTVFSVASYMHTIPHTLGSIYDELMQPLPHVLECILSPNHSADQSVFSQSLLSCESTGPASNAPEISASQPVSDVLMNRTKHNTRYP